MMVIHTKTSSFYLSFYLLSEKYFCFRTQTRIAGCMQKATVLQIIPKNARTCVFIRRDTICIRLQFRGTFFYFLGIICKTVYLEICFVRGSYGRLLFSVYHNSCRERLCFQAVDIAVFYKCPFEKLWNSPKVMGVDFGECCCIFNFTVGV